jgi:uncharacterized protein YsxB (DUF464 family)
MIEVKRNSGGITIQGHAGYAPHGQDIVCAAVSTLVQTFLASVDELTADEMLVGFSQQGQIQSIQYERLSERAQVLLDALFIGIQMIADTYPANVRIVQA